MVLALSRKKIQAHVNWISLQLESWHTCWQWPPPPQQEAKEQMDQGCAHTLRNDIRPEARVSEKSALVHPLHLLISEDISAVQNSLLLAGRKRNTHLDSYNLDPFL